MTQPALRLIDGNGQVQDVPDVQNLLQRIAKLERQLENSEIAARSWKGKYEALYDRREEGRRMYEHREMIHRLFTYWQDVARNGRRGSKLDPKRFDACRKTIDGYIDTLGGAEKMECFARRAIRGLAASDYHMGRARSTGGRRYDDFEIVFRDSQHFEGFVELGGPE